MSVQEQISYNVPSIRLFGNGVGAVSVRELDGLACTFTEVIQLCPPRFAASDRPDVYYVGRMKREDSFNTFVINNPSNSKVFVNAAALTGNYGAGKYLGTLFVAFFDAAVDVHYVANLEVGYFLL